MSGYRCVHIPVHEGTAAAGAKVWLILIVLGTVAWEVLGPWVILGPLALAALVVVAVLVVRHRRARQVEAALPASVSVVPVGRGITTCLGCGWRTAVAVLDLTGHRVPVCDGCRGIALRRIAAGHVRIGGQS